MRKQFRSIPFMAVLMTVFLFAQPGASGTRQLGELTVNNAGAEADDNPGDGVCHTAAGTCTLNAAIQEANASGGAALISFNMVCSGVNTCYLPDNQSAIAAPMTIDGYSQPGSFPNQSDPFQASSAVIVVILGRLKVAAGGDGSVIRGLRTNLVIDHADGCVIAGNEGSVDLQFASNTRIGGTRPRDRNLLLAGFAPEALRIVGGSGNVIQGNFIGTESNGTFRSLQSGAGILVDQATATVVGGSEWGAGNLISAGWSSGVRFHNSTNATVVGNRIGTDGTGLTPVPGSAAVTADGAVNIAVGGSSAGDGNIIANTALGVNIVLGSAISIRGNSIHDNGNSGILISPGSNGDQAAPALAAALYALVSTEITGVLHSAPDSQFAVDLFANPSCDPSGFGEGQTYLGPVAVTTNGAGDGAIHAVVPFQPNGTAITATATDALGNTSRFSACLQVSVPPPVVLVPDGRAVTLPLAGSFNRYESRLVAGRSYSVEVDVPETGAGTIAPGGPAPIIGLYRSDGSPLSTPPSDRAACAPAGTSRLTIIPAAADTGMPVSIQVRDASSDGYPIRTRVVETTLYCPRWTVVNYASMINIANTSACTVSGRVELLDTTASTSPFDSFSFTLAPGEATQIPIPIQGPLQAGSAYLTHDGPPGSLTAGIYAVQLGGSPGADFRWAFEEVRAYGSTDGK